MKRSILFFALIAGIMGQSRPDIAEILKKVGANYQPLKQYQFEIEATDSDSGQSVTSHLRVAFRSPDRYRLEGAVPGLGGIDPSLSAGLLLVYDGSTAWFYFEKTNQYGSFPASAFTADTAGDLGDLRPSAIDDFLTSRYRKAAELAADAKFVKDDTVTIAGAKAACWVVVVKADGSAYTWWIDKKSYRLLREDHEGTRTVFTSIKLDEPIRDEVFRFQPPPGAQKPPGQK